MENVGLDTSALRPCSDVEAVRDALKESHRIVVIDSHGWSMGGIGRHTRQDSEITPEGLVDSNGEGYLDECELLVLGACYHGIDSVIDRWHKLAPNAVVVASQGVVYEKRGCELISRLVKRACDSAAPLTYLEIEAVFGRQTSFRQLNPHSKPSLEKE